MYIVNMYSGCTYKEASFVSLNYLDNISILLDEDNDFEEEITRLLNYFYFPVWKKPNQSGFKYNQNLYDNTG